MAIRLAPRVPRHIWQPMADQDVVARVAGGVGAIAGAEWDALAGSGNPFASHAFLTALEDSGSVGPGTGWQPAPILLEDDTGMLLGAMPSCRSVTRTGRSVRSTRPISSIFSDALRLMCRPCRHDPSDFF